MNNKMDRKSEDKPGSTNGGLGRLLESLLNAKAFFSEVLLETSESLDAQVLSTQLRSSNVFAVLLSLCSFVVSFVLWVYRIPLMAPLASLVGLLFWLPVYLNRRGFFNFSRAFLVVLFNVAIYSFSTGLGRGSATHFWFWTAALIPFAIFSLSEARKILAASLFATGSLVFVWTTHFQISPVPLFNLDAEVLTGISWVMLPLSAAVSVGIVYAVSLGQYEHSLQLAIELSKTVKVDKARSKAIVENITDHSIVLLSADGVILTWNSGAERIKGYTAEEAIGRRFQMLFSQKDRKNGLPEFILRIAQEKGGYRGEGTRVRKSGEAFLAAFSITPVVGESGVLLGFTKIVRDISEERDREKRIELAQIIDRALAAAATEKEVVESILKDVSRFLAWPVGIYWRHDKSLSCLVCSSAISGDNSASVFVEGSRNFSFQKGKGLPGRAWESNQVTWLTDASNDSNFPRFNLARKTGMTSGFVVPVAFGSNFFGCFEFFHQNLQIANPKVVSVFDEAKQLIGQRMQFFAIKEKQQEILEWQKAILDCASQSIISTDVNGTIQTFNKTAERLLGYQAAEVIGTTTPALIHLETEIVERAEVLSREMGRTVQPGFQVFVAKLRKGTVDENEWTYVRKDGSRFPVLLACTAVFSETDEIIGYLGVASDITEKKEIENNLKAANLLASKERARSDGLLLALNQSAIVAITDPRGKITFANDLFCSVSGYTKGELIGEDHRILNSKIHPKAFFEDLWKTISSGRVWRGEIVNRRKSGELYWLASTIVPQMSSQGTVVEYIAIRFDISHQKDIENRMMNTTNSVPAVISHWDKQMRNRFSNQAGYDWFNLSPKEMSGISLQTLLGDESFELARPRVEAVLRGETVRYERDLLRKKDGQIRKVVVSYLPDKVKEEVQGFFICFQDVTDLKLAEERARDGEKRALEAADAKAQFLASISHEIRTPLNSIIGMVDLMFKTSLNQEQKQFLEIALRSGESLLGLVDEVLDFSAIESRKVEFNEEAFSLQYLVELQVDILTIKARQKGLTLVAEISPNLASEFRGDSQRLGQILLNFLSNAVKFTSKGGVVVRAFPSNLGQPAERDSCWIRFEVEDSGIGLSKENIGKLFQPFTQATGSIHKQYGGTGLGLSISKGLVDAMGGKIGVESIEGTGSVFWFEVPLKFADVRGTAVVHKNEGRLVEPEETRVRRKQLQILIADDLRANQILARKLLEGLGYSVSLASSGREVLSVLQEAKIDLILMDCQMPEMDGFETTIRIRELEKSQGGHIPIIALTANAMGGDDKKCSDAGMDAYLSKPIREEKLKSVLEKWLLTNSQKKVAG